MMLGDVNRVRANVRQATTEDLLDRATVYRAGMEPEALTLIDEELWRRGVREEDVAAHAAQREEGTLFLPDGTAVPCSQCHRPAVAHAWGWHHLWGLLPGFPRQFYYCDEHCPPELRPATDPHPPE
jgi:hypothetical protein